MADADIGRLLVRLDADVSRLEAKLDRAVQRNSQAMRRIVTDTDTAMARARNSLGNVWSAGQNRLLQQGTASLGLLGEGLSALGPAGIAAGAAMGALALGMQQAREAMRWADDLGDTADRLGVTAEQLQVMEQSLEHFGGSAEEGRQAIQRLNQAIGALRTGVGAGRAQAAFGALGITEADLRNVQNAADLLPLLADRIQRLGNAADQTAIARRLGIEPLLPLLRQGSEGVRQYEERLRAMGAVVSNETVGTLNDLAERTREADVRMQAASRTISANLAPALAGLAEVAAGTITQIARLVGWLTSLDARQQTALLRVQNARHMQQTFGRLPRIGPEGWGGAETRQAARDIGSGVGELATLAIERALAATPADAAAAAGPSVAVRTTGGGRSRARAGGGSSRGARSTSSSIHVSDGGEPVSAADQFMREVGASNLIGLSQEEFQTAFAMWLDLRRDGVQSNPSLHGFVSTTDANNNIHEDLSRNHEQLARDWASIVEDGLDAAIHGGWKGLVQWMGQTLERELIRSLAGSVGQMLANLSNPMGGGGGGIGGLIRGAIGVFTGNPALIATSVVGTIPLPTHAHAAGTMAAPGGLSWVGERGPELVNLPKGAQVFPAHVSRALALDGARSSVSNVTINLHADGAVLGNELVNTLMQIGEARIATAEANLRVSIPADLARRSARRLS